MDVAAIVDKLNVYDGERKKEERKYERFDN